MNIGIRSRSMASTYFATYQYASIHTRIIFPILTFIEGKGNAMFMLYFSFV